jgi:hypothetical protein
MFIAEGRVLKGIYMGLVRLGCELELCGIIISPIGAEVRKAVSRVGPRVQEQLEIEGFCSEVREDVKRMSGNSVGEVGDNGEAVPSIRSFVRGCEGVRKSRGRVRT